MMRRACSRWLTVLAGLAAAAAVAAPAAAGAAGILVDHTATDPGAIPAAALDAARALTMRFDHASVGGNIWAGLGLLRSDDGARYSFPNWVDRDRGNPSPPEKKVDDFETDVAAHLSGTQVFLNKFCFIDQDASFPYYRDSMVKLKSLYPTKTFVWFTMPIRTDGPDNAKRAAFNAAVRAYAQAHDVPLFDLADIESHRPDGSAVASGGAEAMFGDYASDGGHLSPAGERRVAGAMWQLMARLGGWNTSSDPTHPTDPTDPTHPTDPTTPTDSGGSGGGCSSTDPGLAGAALLLALLPALRRRRAARA